MPATRTVATTATGSMSTIAPPTTALARRRARTGPAASVTTVPSML
jgi:hypothetical protein